jgi:hypothetical protein
MTPEILTLESLILNELELTSEITKQLSFDSVVLREVPLQSCVRFVLLLNSPLQLEEV